MGRNLTKSPAFRAALRAGKGMRAAWAAARHSRRRNPLLQASNPRRRGKRRGHRRRSNPLVRMFNPGLPSLGKVTSTVKSAVSTENLKKGAAVAATVAASWLLPAKFLPARDVGLQGAGLSLAAGIVAAAAIGAAMPAAAGVALASAVGATVLKLGLGKAKEALGLGGFLTLNGPVGQLPAGLIAGLNGQGRVGDFLEMKRPVVAIGPKGLGGGERFSRTY